MSIIELILSLFANKKTSTDPDEEYKNMKKIFARKSEVVAFLKEQTGCDSVTVNDKTVLLVDKEWALRRMEEFGVNKRKYLKDFDIFEEIAAIENSTLSDLEKAAKFEELCLTINHDCEDFADVLKAEFIKINGWLAIGRIDAQREKNGKKSAHAFNFMITTEWELIFIEPQTNGTWTQETNTWEPYKITK